MSDLRPDHARRYLRQILLPQIGADGQARIAGASAPLRGESLAHEVAALYAERAGFARIDQGPSSLLVGEGGEVVRDPSARSVLAGARAAARAILQAVSQSPVERGKFE